MKCPKCGYEQAIYDDINEWWHCPQCHGTGEVEMTNEEWFCGLPTEEKAEFLVMIQMSVMHPVKRGAVDMDMFIEDVAEWLKQPHTNE